MKKITALFCSFAAVLLLLFSVSLPASAEGLKDNGDSLHFNNKSLLEFGLRYYDAFKTVEIKDRVFDEKSKMDDAIRTEMELL
jgi:hypothetical protein